MARRSRFIDSKTAQSLGQSLILNTNGVQDPRFAVDALYIRNSITYTGTPAGDLGADDVGQTRIEALYDSLNVPFLNNVTYQTLDLWAARHWHPAQSSFNVLATQTVAAAGTFNFDFVCPVKRQQGKRPADYCVALSEFGQVTVQLPAALTPAGGTFASWTVEIYAIGQDVPSGEFIAGALQRVDELTGESGNVVDLRCYGHKVADLFGFSADSGSSAISGNTSPRVEFDGREVVNFRGLNGSQTSWAWGDLRSADSYDNFVTVSGYQNALVEDLVPAGYLQKIGGMESVNTAQVFYNSRLASTSDQRYALTTLYPSQAPAQLAQRVPGGAAAGADAIEAIASTPAASGGVSAGARDSAYLPKVVNT